MPDQREPCRIDGNALASRLRDQLARQVAELAAEYGVVPGLAVILVGEDPASRIYVGRKIRFTKEIGMASFEHRLEIGTSEDALLTLVAKLNEDRAVHGILVQLPLPEHIDATKILNALDPAKDVDGFHPLNVGRLSTGTGGMVPCTALGCLLLIEQVVPDLSGLNACVVGRSNIVGKPVAQLLLQRGCTVTIAHSKTQDLPSAVRAADIVVAAVGQARLIRGDWVRPGAVVIDVGINSVASEVGVTRLVGDVAFDEMQHAAAVTPVPGGVGPMTIACLLSNTLLAAQARA